MKYCQLMEMALEILWTIWNVLDKELGMLAMHVAFYLYILGSIFAVSILTCDKQYPACVRIIPVFPWYGQCGKIQYKLDFTSFL